MAEASAAALKQKLQNATASRVLTALMEFAAEKATKSAEQSVDAASTA